MVKMGTRARARAAAALLCACLCAGAAAALFGCSEDAGSADAPFVKQGIAPRKDSGEEGGPEQGERLREGMRAQADYLVARGLLEEPDQFADPDVISFCWQALTDEEKELVRRNSDGPARNLAESLETSDPTHAAEEGGGE